MASNLVEISDKQMVLGLIKTSKAKPVYIFKYANTCRWAARIINDIEELGVDVYGSAMYNRAYSKNKKLEIAYTTAKNDLCRFIGSSLGVEHNTPQLIILDQGKVDSYYNCVSTKSKDNIIAASKIHEKIKAYNDSRKK